MDYIVGSRGYGKGDKITTPSITVLQIRVLEAKIRDWQTNSFGAVIGPGTERYILGDELRGECQGNIPTASVLIGRGQVWSFPAPRVPDEVRKKIGTSCRSIDVKSFRTKQWVKDCKGGCQGRGWAPSDSLDAWLSAISAAGYGVQLVKLHNEDVWSVGIFDNRGHLISKRYEETPMEALTDAIWDTIEWQRLKEEG